MGYLTNIKDEETIKADAESVETAKDSMTGSGDPEITNEKLTAVYPYLQWLGETKIPEGYEEYGGKGFGQVAAIVGLTKEQVKSLKEEYDSYKTE